MNPIVVYWPPLRRRMKASLRPLVLWWTVGTLLTQNLSTNNLDFGRTYVIHRPTLPSKTPWPTPVTIILNGFPFRNVEVLFREMVTLAILPSLTPLTEPCIYYLLTLTVA